MTANILIVQNDTVADEIYGRAKPRTVSSNAVELAKLQEQIESKDKDIDALETQLHNAREERKALWRMSLALKEVSWVWNETENPFDSSEVHDVRTDFLSIFSHLRSEEGTVLLRVTMSDHPVANITDMLLRARLKQHPSGTVGLLKYGEKYFITIFGKGVANMVAYTNDNGVRVVHATSKGGWTHSTPSTGAELLKTLRDYRKQVSERPYAEALQEQLSKSF